MTRLQYRDEQSDTKKPETQKVSKVTEGKCPRCYQWKWLSDDPNDEARGYLCDSCEVDLILLAREPYESGLRIAEAEGKDVTL